MFSTKVINPAIKVTVQDVLDAISHYDKNKGTYRKWSDWGMVSVDQADMAKLKSAFALEFAGVPNRCLSQEETLKLVKILIHRTCVQNSESAKELQTLEDKFSSFVLLCRLLDNYHILDTVFQQIYLHAKNSMEILGLIRLLESKEIDVLMHADEIFSQESYDYYNLTFEYLLGKIIEADVPLRDYLPELLRYAKYAEYLSKLVLFVQGSGLPLISALPFLFQKSERLASIESFARQSVSYDGRSSALDLDSLMGLELQVLEKVEQLVKFFDGRYVLTPERFGLICKHAEYARLIIGTMMILEETSESGLNEMLDRVLASPIGAISVNESFFSSESPRPSLGLLMSDAETPASSSTASIRSAMVLFPPTGQDIPPAANASQSSPQEDLKKNYFDL